MRTPVFAAQLQDPSPSMPRTIGQCLMRIELHRGRLGGTRAARRNAARRLFQKICKRHIDPAGNGVYLATVAQERASWMTWVAKSAAYFQRIEAEELARLKSPPLAA